MSPVRTATRIVGGGQAHLGGHGGDLGQRAARGSRRCRPPAPCSGETYTTRVDALDRPRRRRGPGRGRRWPPGTRPASCPTRSARRSACRARRRSGASPRAGARSDRPGTAAGTTPPPQGGSRPRAGRAGAAGPGSTCRAGGRDAPATVVTAARSERGPDEPARCWVPRRSFSRAGPAILSPGCDGPRPHRAPRRPPAGAGPAGRGSAPPGASGATRPARGSGAALHPRKGARPSRRRDGGPGTMEGVHAAALRFELRIPESRSRSPSAPRCDRSSTACATSCGCRSPRSTITTPGSAPRSAWRRSPRATGASARCSAPSSGSWTGPRASSCSRWSGPNSSRPTPDCRTGDGPAPATLRPHPAGQRGGPRMSRRPARAAVGPPLGAGDPHRGRRQPRPAPHDRLLRGARPPERRHPRHAAGRRAAPAARPGPGGAAEVPSPPALPGGSGDRAGPAGGGDPPRAAPSRPPRRGAPVTDTDLHHATRLVRDADQVALACHVNPDGDALGSMLGLFHVLAGRP